MRHGPPTRGRRPRLLRRALDDVAACEALAPSEQDSLKTGYLDVISLLDQPTNPGREVPLWRFSRFYHPDYTLNPEQIQAIWDWWRFWRREPQRSRRVIRLVTANWLAYYDLPPGNRPKPDKIAALPVYPLGPRRRPRHVPCPPRPWIAGSTPPTTPSKCFISWIPVESELIERAYDGEFLLLLAEELYRRDHGTDPPSPEALVGPYLKSLPEK